MNNLCVLVSSRALNIMLNACWSGVHASGPGLDIFAVYKDSKLFSNPLCTFAPGLIFGSSAC